MDFKVLYDKAHDAGMAAAKDVVPAPMFINGYAPVMDGVCGFAWVHFKGNTAFGKWAKKVGVAKKAYPNGLMIWVGDFNQSMTRKEAYASEFSKVLRAEGVDAYARSRMD